MTTVRGLLNRILDVKEYTVWHPESPGVKVLVRRSRFGRLLKRNFFASGWEIKRRPHVKV